MRERLGILLLAQEESVEGARGPVDVAAYGRGVLLSARRHDGLEEERVVRRLGIGKSADDRAQVVRGDVHGHGRCRRARCAAEDGLPPTRRSGGGSGRLRRGKRGCGRAFGRGREERGAQPRAEAARVDRPRCDGKVRELSACHRRQVREELVEVRHGIVERLERGVVVRRQERLSKCVRLGARDEVRGERRRERHALEDLEQPDQLAVAAAQCAEVHRRQRARGACLVEVAAYRVLGDVVCAGLGDD